jgi:uncharacterized damage-inducible protein DinB
MIFQVGIENNNEGRTLAWALEHPGCFAYGTKQQSALINLENALDRYAGWILHHTRDPWLSYVSAEVEFVINGIWDVYFINDDFDRTGEKDSYSVESFFPFDWKPLTRQEIRHAVEMLAWSREDLLKAVHGLDAARLEKTYPGERWSINGILAHVGGAEWWYLDRLGLSFPRSEVPEEPFARLEKVRKAFIASLVKLEGVKQVVGASGEIWSPRKMLRRALWHELDHVEHIQKLLPL